MSEKELKITATAETAAAKAAVDDLNASIKATAPAQDAATGSELRGVEGLKALQDQMRAAASGASTLGAATTGAAEGASLLSRAVQGLTSTKGNLILILVMLVTHLKEVNEWMGRAADKMVGWLTAAGQGTKVLDEHGKAVDALDPKYKKLAEAQDLAARATKAMAAGLIQVTEDTKRANAEELIREAALHGSIMSTKDYAEALKTLGIKTVESFDNIKGSAQAFEREYGRVMKTEGPAAARIFAEENSSVLDKVQSRYIKLGQEVPPELKKISDGIGLIPKAAAEAEKSDASFKKLTESIYDLETKTAGLNKSLVDNGKAFQDNSAKIEANRKTAIESSQAVTAQTIKGLQDQVKETEAAHAARTISDSDYRTKIAQLYADQAKAKQDGYETEKQVDADAKKDLEDLAGKYKEQTDKVKEALSDVATKQEEATAKLKALNVERDAEVRAMQTAVPLWGTSAEFAKLLAGVQATLATETKASAGATKDLGAQFGASAAQVPALGAGIDSLTSKMNTATAAAKALAAALDSVTGGTA